MKIQMEIQREGGREGGREQASKVARETAVNKQHTSCTLAFDDSVFYEKKKFSRCNLSVSCQFMMAGY